MKTGAIAIAAITSCTNTSNPYVLIGAGLVAKKAVELGLKVPNYVKTSLAPGSKVVTGYLVNSGLLPYMRELDLTSSDTAVRHVSGTPDRLRLKSKKRLPKMTC